MIAETEHFILDYIVGTDYFGAKGLFPPRHGLNIYTKGPENTLDKVVVLIRPTSDDNISIKYLNDNLTEDLSSDEVKTELDSLVGIGKARFERTLIFGKLSDFIGD